MNIEQTIRDYLPRIIHMSLGTCKDNKPWVCEVHFVYDDNLNLYFRSLTSRRHSQDIAANPQVAGNIVRQHAVGEYPLGLYFEGNAELLTTEKERRAVEPLFKERLSVTADILGEAADSEGHQFYKITVENWYAFGKFDGDKGQKIKLTWNSGTHHMIQPMYKAIVFDFFGVFCAPMATNWFKKAVLDYEAKKEAFQELCTESDLGKLTRAEFNRKAAELAGVSITDVEHGIEAEVLIDTELVAYARKLKADGYRIVCLSNGGHEWTLKVITDHGLRDLFEEVVLSADLGIVKPDPDTYLKTLEKLKLPAAQTIFVDDREANVVAAEACGMRGLVFTDTAKFTQSMRELSNEGAR